MWVLAVAHYGLVVVPVVIGYLAVPVPATTLTATFGQQTWENSTLSPITAIFDSVNMQAQPTKITKDDHSPSMSSIPRRSNVKETALVQTNTSAVVTSNASDIVSALLGISHASLPAPGEVAGRSMSDIAACSATIMSACLHPSGLRISNAGTNSSILINNASTPNANDHTVAGQTVPDLHSDSWSVVFLNTSSPSYVSIDCANANIAICMVSANKSATVRETPSSEFIQSFKICVEALGILAVLWEIGRFIHVKIRSCRERRVENPAAL